MSKQKQKGTAFETAVVRYMQKWYPDVERRALQGENDTGDIAGLEIQGYPVVVECKNTKQLDISGHMKEAIREAQNAHAAFTVLIQHAPRIGFDKDENTGLQWAIMPLHDFMELFWLAEGNGYEPINSTYGE